VILSLLYLLVRCLLGCLTVLTWHQVSKDAELLVLRHENAVLRRQIGRVRYQPGGRLWLGALSRLIPRRRWGDRERHQDSRQPAAGAQSERDLRQDHRNPAPGAPRPAADRQ
jgi:hypothetical protein